MVATGKLRCALDEAKAHAFEAGTGVALEAACCCRVDPTPDPLAGGLGSGQTHRRSLRKQAAQVGFTSSHFFLRRRQERHPRRDRAPFVRNMEAEQHSVHRGDFKCDVRPRGRRLIVDITFQSITVRQIEIPFCSSGGNPSHSAADHVIGSYVLRNALGVNIDFSTTRTQREV